MNPIGEIKSKFFPQITDWTIDYQGYKYTKDWTKLPDMVFIFFNLKGTKVSFYPTSFLALALMLGLLYYSYTLYPISALIPAYIIYRLSKMVWSIHKKIKADMTLYDIFLKESKNV